MNLLIGHPWVVEEGELARGVELAEWNRRPYAVYIEQRRLPSTARFVGIPLDGRRQLVALYLVPDPALDRMIESGELTPLPLAKSLAQPGGRTTR